MPPRKGPATKPYALRLPLRLYHALKRLAVANSRSLNAEIVAACEKWNALNLAEGGGDGE
jgi:hypothetical protein